MLLEFEIGRSYAGYEFLELLNDSAENAEYRVRNALAGRDEFLKIAGTDGEAFLQEGRILARLSHPYIVEFYCAQPIEGHMAMASEWGTPGRLSLPWREAVQAGMQLLSALAYLHANRVLHLDVRPESIRCCAGGAWKLANFAAARLIDGAPIASTGEISGNPKYVAPEQVIRGSALDHRTDLYCFATVLYEMICGRPPFDAASRFELMLAQVNRDPAPPGSIAASLPRGLDAVLLKALAKDRAERFQSAEAFAKALARVEEEAAVPVAAGARAMMPGASDCTGRVTDRAEPVAGSIGVVASPVGVGIVEEDWAGGPEGTPAYPTDLQEKLWEVAEIVCAAAAVEPPAPVEPVSVVAVPQPAPPPAPEPVAPFTIPAHIAAARKPDMIHWVMFGSSAAFLGIIWIAIFFALR